MLVLRSRFRRFHCTSDLLFHPLHMVVAASRVVSAASIAVSAAGLKEVGLSELVQWLTRTAAWRTSDLGEDLIVEILGELLLAAQFVVNASSGGQKLLQLNAGDEILILRSHQTVVLAQQENLVVAFRPVGLFRQISLSLFWRHLHHLLGLSDGWTVVRRSAVVRHLFERLTVRLHCRSTHWHVRRLSGLPRLRRLALKVLWWRLRGVLPLQDLWCAEAIVWRWLLWWRILGHLLRSLQDLGRS